jgi:hypothetical protein
MANHLGYRPVRKHRPQAGLIHSKHLVRQKAERLQLVPPKVTPATLREPEDEETPFAPAKEQDRAKPAGAALSLPCDTLLEDAAAEVGIDRTSFSAVNGIAQGCIRYSLAFGEASEGLGLERAQSETS